MLIGFTQERMEAFLADQAPTIRKRTAVFLLLGSILMPVSGLTDLFLTPQHFSEFLLVRGLTAVSGLLLLLYNQKKNLRQNSFHLAQAGMLLGGLALIYMIVRVGGYGAPNYIGLLVGYLAFCVILPVGAKRLLPTCVALYTLHIIAVVVFCEPQQLALFYVNNAATAITILFLMVAARENLIERIYDFQSRTELLDARQVLEEYSQSLEDSMVQTTKQWESEKKRMQRERQQAQKMESIGTLAGGIAHDFNNLLTVITGNITLTLMDLQPENPMVENLEEIKKAAIRASELTQHLLTFSRQQVIEPKVICLNELLQGSVSLLTRLLNENIRVELDLTDQLGKIKVDPVRMEQIIVNLAINSRDAMPQGGHLQFSTANVFIGAEFTSRHPKFKQGQYVLLTVRDNGEGMNAETRAKAFEPFFSTKPVGKGTGLGLSTTYGIIKQHYGYIDLTSTLGEGTTIKIYLPRVVEQTNLQSATRPLKLSLPIGNEVLLVVEDEDMVRKTAIRTLSRLGYKVYGAHDGKSALFLFRQQGESIDLVITDVVMPGMNGRELADKLRGIHNGIKVLFSSGYADEAIIQQGLMEKEVEFLSKPYSLQALADKVRQVLDS